MATTTGAAVSSCCDMACINIAVSCALARTRSCTISAEVASDAASDAASSCCCGEDAMLYTMRPDFFDDASAVCTDRVRCRRVRCDRAVEQPDLFS